MLWLDLETYNEQDISVGVYKYAETAEVLLFAYAFEDGPVRVWDNTCETMPGNLCRWLTDDKVLLCAHNAQFDRVIIAHALNLPTRRERWRCTMVQAYSHAFQGSLDAVGRVLGLPTDKAKLDTGKKHIHRFCKPAPSNHNADRYDAQSNPQEWADFKKYAAMDIEAMREVAKRLPDWNWKSDDIALYHLDQTINDRGFEVDRELVEAGARAAITDKARMANEFIQLTGGEVEKPTQRERFRLYLNENFALDLDNTRAETFRELLADGDVTDERCRRLMELSIQTNKTSTAKFAALAPAISSDGRFKGGLQFRGAARTRRYAGRGFQPQNLPSRGLPGQRSVDQFIIALKSDTHDILFDDVVSHASAALRGVLVAPQGKSLAIADLSNIEGRINAWLAGETWKIDAFFSFDAGEGPDLYNITAGSILGQDPYKIEKRDRNVFGKVPELALGYGAGFGGLQTFAKGYGVSLVDHWDTIRANVDPVHLTSAKANYTKWGAEKNPEADEMEWIASETVKLAWRARHPKISRLWKACEEAATLALENPGKIFSAGRHMKFALRQHAGQTYLLNRLPSGKFLCYFEPRLSDDGSITYMGVDSTATGGMYGKWQRQYTYGGKFVENACQSLALDILTSSMHAIEAEGFQIVLTVHDEIIAETDRPDGAKRLAELMSTAPDWLPNFPLAADGFNAVRYRK